MNVVGRGACVERRKTIFEITAGVVEHKGIFSVCRRLIGGDNIGKFLAGNCIIQRSNGALKSGCVSSVIPADGSVKRINSYAFQRVPIQSVIIPEGVMEIGSSAFYECASLTEIEIPSTVTIIGRTAFNGCNNLQSITVAEANKVFCVKEGCLVRIEDNALVFSPSYVIPEGVSAIAESAFDGCADMKEVTIPDSVTQIGTNAFYGCTGLIEIVIPEGVIEIGNGTFRNCLNLTTVTIPVSVTKIGSTAFYSCKNLKTVYFGGTAEQWAAITVGSGNNELLNANVICQGGL